LSDFRNRSVWFRNTWTLTQASCCRFRLQASV